MFDTLDELTYDQEEDGVLVRKQLDRAVLTSPGRGGGGWATVMFLYAELDPARGVYRAPKIAIVRFKKWNGVYRKQSSLNVSSEAQARQIADVFGRWYATMGATERDGEEAGLEG
jgi:hypothetical protein